MMNSLFNWRRGGGVLSLFFTQNSPKIFVGFSAAGNTLAGSRLHVAWEPHDELSFQKPSGGRGP